MVGHRSSILSLYRSIRRAHRTYLPPDMRSLGDSYVASEFRAHRAVTDQSQIDKFVVAWNGYLDHLVGQGRMSQLNMTKGETDAGGGGGGGKAGGGLGFGKELPPVAELSQEQKVKLEDLRREAEKVGGGKNGR